ncbi:hypothetical protein ASZ90_017572 [hydrocarbon metagenome]|uniref:Uncharacterized protein n=1 Tax=hydrocarbon metagenome TaxID=938273 RepID=A0A0W8E8V9_9ZZZZ
MERSTVRVVLYFSKDHPIAKYRSKERTRVAKDWIEQALALEKSLKEIQTDVKSIKDMLNNGVYHASAPTPEHSTNTELSATDIDLIDQMLGLK